MDRNKSRAHYAWLTAALVLIGLGSAVQAQSVNHPPKTIADIARQAMADYGVPGLAIASIESGRVSWMGAFGKADEQRPLRRNTVFNVASLTKPMFAVMVMHLVQDGRFYLDDPLSQYWIDPDVENDPRHWQLTARVSLSHQTGFPNWRGNNSLHFMFDPGSRHEYSGEGFEYLRRAVEHKTGNTMAELMEQYVTAPLKLNQTYYGWHRSLEPRIATGYDESASPMDMAYLRNREANAAANTFTTIADYGEFAAWVSRGAGLDKMLLKEMMRPQSMHENPWEFFGLGWRLLQLEENTILEHDGREDGVRTQVFVDPVHQSGLVLLTNSSNGELLVRPLTLAAMEDGEALMHQRDADIWHYVQSIPGQAHMNMLNFIARSPSFTSKLLYGAQVGLIEQSGLTEAEQKIAREAIDPFVAKVHSGDRDANEVMQLFTLLGTGEGEDFRLVDAFTPAQAKQWTNQLRASLGTHQ